MKLPIDRPQGQNDFPGFKTGLKLSVAIPLAIALAGCGTVGGGDRPAGMSAISAVPLTGPQADFPVVVGPPYEIAGVTYTPADIMNYDEVGYVAAGEGQGITAAHHTLPLPSYVEVTSLESGRTILARVERRGPMGGNQLLALSPSAMQQLGAGAGVPVRVRRVNPPEDHRAMLRGKEQAPLRMDTPMALVEVLKRKLPAASAAAPASVVAPAPSPVPRMEPIALPPSTAAQDQTFAETFEAPDRRAPAPPPTPAQTRPQPMAPAVTSGLVVQAGAFSAADRAQRVAQAIGGSVSRSGNLYRVRTGPFATRAEAEASLAKVRDAGYSDARIFTSG